VIDDQIKIEHPKVLLLGKTGQVGSDLLPLLAGFSELHAPDRRDLDLSHPKCIRDLVRTLQPDVIVNAAAYTAVDKAEGEPEAAATLNTHVPALLAEEAARSRALLIHYSTDYVFDGAKPQPYVESDPVNPQNVYGKTKAAGEDAITASGCRHLIFRTSWVFSPRGSNFLLTILRLAREREELLIVNDQIGAPTSSESIARSSVQVLKQWLGQNLEARGIKTGTYHLTSSGHVSWFDFAREIIRQYGSDSLRVRKITPIYSRDYPTPARRPQNSRLDCSKIEVAYQIVMPHWQTSLSAVLEPLLRC